MAYQHGYFLPGTTPERKFFLGDQACGPTFYAEIEAYGGPLNEHWSLHTPGWLWDTTIALEFFEDTPAEVIDGVIAAYEAHDPDAVAPKQ